MGHKFKIGDIIAASGECIFIGLIMGMNNDHYDIYWIKYNRALSRPPLKGYISDWVDIYFRKI
jgi:hypothetical protein